MDHHEIKCALAKNGITLTNIGNSVSENIVLVRIVTNGTIETQRHFKIAKAIARAINKDMLSIWPDIDTDVFNIDLAA